jgi:hypothetical protein
MSGSTTESGLLPPINVSELHNGLIHVRVELGKQAISTTKVFVKTPADYLSSVDGPTRSSVSKPKVGTNMAGALSSMVVQSPKTKAKDYLNQRRASIERRQMKQRVSRLTRMSTEASISRPEENDNDDDDESHSENEAAPLKYEVTKLPLSSARVKSLNGENSFRLRQSTLGGIQLRTPKTDRPQLTMTAQLLSQVTINRSNVMP